MPVNTLTDELYPEHDRTSCSDAHPINATAEGSTGCARCTALVMDRAASYRETVQRVARMAFTAWDNDQDAKVGKLLRALADPEFAKTYLPDQPDLHP